MIKLKELLLRKPKRLKKGDTIGIVAPAWSFDPERFHKGVVKLKRLGFKVKYDRSIFNRYWSLAGYDEQRAEQINQMFADREVKAILCAKAGYGSMRTIPHLDQTVIRRNPKIFVGYSDITILLEYLQRTANMIVFHGPVVAGQIHAKMSGITLDYLLYNLMQAKSLGEVTFPGMVTMRPGRAAGKLVGGNISLIVSGIGTAYDIDTDNKILFLEDVGEDMENIDNMLLHLKLAGKFKKVKGIIFGRMIDCYDDSGRKYKIRNIVNDALGDLDIPIILGFPSGHARGNGANVTLPLGAAVVLDTTKPSIFFNEAGVR